MEDSQPPDPTSGHSTGQSSGDRRQGRRRSFKSPKLDHTLTELESAFLNWESLTSPDDSSELRGLRDERQVLLKRKFREATQALLEQLRHQIAELNE